MSSQQNESSSQRDGDEPTNGGAERSGAAAGTADTNQSTQNAAGQPQPPPQQGPQDLFGLLSNILPQAMEGIMNSVLAGGGARQGEQAAAGAAPNEQQQQPQAPPLNQGFDQVMGMLRQQQQMWANLGETMERTPEERRRMAEQAREHRENEPNNGNPTLANIMSQLEGAVHNWHATHAQQQQPPPAARPVPTAPPINFIEQLTAAAAGLAGTGQAGGGNGQSFMERLQAAAGAAQPGTSNAQQQQPQPQPPQPAGEHRHRHVIDLPMFGRAHIELVGMPGNLDQMIRQLREGFDPGASSGSRIPEEHLARLPNSSVRQKHVDDGKQCFICMDQYTEVGERVAEMTCGHIFHSSCIVPWLQRNTTCPVCRAEVVSRNWIFDEMELD